MADKGKWMLRGVQMASGSPLHGALRTEVQEES